MTPAQPAGQYHPRGFDEIIAELPSSSFYSSLRFGHGLGGWGRTELFATNRSKLTVIDVGIEGRHVLASP